MHSATSANRKPTPQPTTISHHPCGVVSTRAGEIGNSGRGFIAERRDVDRLRGRDPGHEQRQQQRAEPEHGAERRRAQHVDRVPGGGLFAALAAAAEFIETERRERAEQGKAGGQRKQQRQHRIAEHRARQHQAEHRIDHAEDDGVARHRLEILPAEPQRLVQVGQADGSDDRCSRGVLRRLSQWRDIAWDMVWPWSLSPLPQRPQFRAGRSAQAAVCGNDHDQARREDRKPKLAMSRTEPSAYSQSPAPSLTLR